MEKKQQSAVIFSSTDKHCWHFGLPHFLCTFLSWGSSVFICQCQWSSGGDPVVFFAFWHYHKNIFWCHFFFHNWRYTSSNQSSVVGHRVGILSSSYYPWVVAMMLTFWAPPSRAMDVAMAVAVGVGRKAGRQGGTEDNAFVGSSLQEAP